MPLEIKEEEAYFLYYLLCHVPIMVGAGYITQAEADELNPELLEKLRDSLGFPEE